MVRVARHSEVIEKISPVFDFLLNMVIYLPVTLLRFLINPKELIKLGSFLSKTKVNVIYFADSLGSASPPQFQK